MMHNPFSLSGKTIFITGASSGIGRAVAIECAKMEATLIISGRNEERLFDTLNNLEGDGHQAIVVDLNSGNEIERLVNALPNLSGVVHCAGISDSKPFQFISKAQINSIFDSNLFAPIIITQSLIKQKKIEKNSAIIFISSINGVYCSSASSSLYASTKGAINGIAKGMAIDLAPKGIRVNCVNPGMIETNFFKGGIFTDEQIRLDKLKYPLRRYGKPEEVAYATIYLLSDAAQWITGTNLLIDGGYTLL